MSNVVVDMMVGGLTVPKINYAGKTYLPVEYGREFSIRIRNNGNKRICAVVSVDGLSVMNGEQASHDGAGYVVEAGSIAVINGWRRGDSEVAAFEVVAKGTSYASRMKKGGNEGVIGVAIYEEKPVMREMYYFNTKLDCSEEPTCGGIVCEELTSRSINEAGTGYGQVKSDYVDYTEFERNLGSKRVIVLYYDTIEGLKKKGVPVDTVVGCPNPFPCEPRELYCPPPPKTWG